MLQTNYFPFFVIQLREELKRKRVWMSRLSSWGQSCGCGTSPAIRQHGGPSESGEDDVCTLHHWQPVAKQRSSLRTLTTTGPQLCRLCLISPAHCVLAVQRHCVKERQTVSASFGNRLQCCTYPACLQQLFLCAPQNTR